MVYKRPAAKRRDDVPKGFSHPSGSILQHILKITPMLGKGVTSPKIFCATPIFYPSNVSFAPNAPPIPPGVSTIPTKLPSVF
jgi:hypothetical protein